MAKAKVVVKIVTVTEQEMELDDCPFCGSSQLDMRQTENGDIAVFCDCGIVGPAREKDIDAINAWNGRTASV